MFKMYLVSVVFRRVASIDMSVLKTADNSVSVVSLDSDHAECIGESCCCNSCEIDLLIEFKSCILLDTHFTDAVLSQSLGQY